MIKQICYRVLFEAGKLSNTEGTMFELISKAAESYKLTDDDWTWIKIHRPYWLNDSEESMRAKLHDAILFELEDIYA